MRIAYFLGVFPAVSETFILDQITGLVARGHEVHVYADPPPPGAPVHADVERFRLLERTHHRPGVPASFPRRLLGAIPHVLRAPSLIHPRHGREALSLRLAYASAPCRGERYDAIHAHFGPNGLLAVRLRRAGVIHGPIATTFLGYDLSSWRGSYRELMEGGDLFLPICEYFRGILLERGFPAARMQVHHLGVDASVLAFTPRVKSGGPVRLVSVVRLVEKKGIEYAIEAVAAVRREGLDVDHTVVGDGPLRARLEARIRELDAGSFVRITGFRDRAAVAEVLASSHVLLAPSVTASDGDQEGTPVAILEAMACGMPVISTVHSGIPEMIEHGASGLLVPERDVPALAAALRELASHPERWEAMGRAGRARVLAAFDREKLNDRLVGLLGGMRS